MGDRRKLNAEIERCLKKVSEGVEIFEETWHKVQSATSHNQKDRHEQELKREIKKLQRLRDQIKTWMSSPDIKDKTALLDARRTIEQQMERFKVVERETKTKAYSNGGLGAGPKLDPQEKEKEECMNWIKEAIRELEIQRDKFESDIESLSATFKKKKADRDKQERLDDLKRWMERHKYHITSLQKILRAIDNEAVDIKAIQEIHADVEYYVESNQETDFKENDMMYDVIDMDNLNTIMGSTVPVPNSAHATASSTMSSISSASSNSNLTTPVDITGAMTILHSSSYNITERIGTSTTTSASNSTHEDADSVTGTTTPSLTQPSSPSTSPALLLPDEQKRSRIDVNETYPQRIRSNSGANGSSSTNQTHSISPKISLSTQNSPAVQLSTKNPLSLASSTTNSASPHFNYPASSSSSSTSPSTVPVPPVLPYSAIVSQNTPSSTATSTASSASKTQPNILSPSTKSTSRQLSINTTSTTVTTNNPGLSISSTSSSHPPSLLTVQGERTGSSNVLSQSNSSISSVTLTSGSAVNSSLYSGSVSSLNNSNVPLGLPSTSTSILEPSLSIQQSSSSTQAISEKDHLTNTNLTGSTLTSNGTSDSHGILDSILFSNHIPSSTSTITPLNGNSPSTVSNTNMSSAYIPNTNLNDLQPSSNGGMMSQGADSHSFRYLSGTSSNQQSILNNRVPLTHIEAQTLNRLNTAYSKLPALLESERQRANVNRICGRSPLNQSQIIPYYPHVPPASSDTPEFYYRLAPETLFFVFYYMEGTRAQYLAAKALKRQSWRFHTKYMMWFQRHEEPKTITDDYEQGTYIFFDYERWQTRKSDNFTFEYKFLEDREY